MVHNRDPIHVIFHKKPEQKPWMSKMSCLETTLGPDQRSLMALSSKNG